MPARRGAHRGKPCPPAAAGRLRGPPIAHPPFPPRRIQRGRAELVPPAPSRWGTRPAPLTPSAGPGTGSWWQRGQRRATAGAEPACRGEPSRGTPSPSPARPRGPCPDPPLPPRRFHSPGGEREPRGRCLPCAAAPRSTPGCPGGCWSRRCHPRAGGDGGACAGPPPGDATGCVPLGMEHHVLRGCGSLRHLCSPHKPLLLHWGPTLVRGSRGDGI